MEKKFVHPKLIWISVVFFILLPMLGLGFAQQAPTPTAPSGPRYGGILKVSIYMDGVSIGYPPKCIRIFGMAQASPAIETLFRHDNTGKLTPWLATGIKSNATAKTTILTLRKGVKFHDGTNFNAEAVKWNLDRHLAEKTAAVQKIKSIDVIDDYTVRINLSEWDSTFEGTLAMNTGMMISPTAYEKNGQEWCEKNPVGTGPFEFVSWEKDVRTIYKKFPGYWQKGKPYVDGIEWYIIADHLTRENEFKKRRNRHRTDAIAEELNVLGKGWLFCYPWQDGRDLLFTNL